MTDEDNKNMKVLELRNYLLKPKAREKFIEYFENHFIDSQNMSGGYVLGQFRIKGKDDRFLWMRGFEDMQSRLAFLRGFYEEGEVWKKFGTGANEMILESDNVYLLKPLNNETFNSDDFAKEKGIVMIDFYFANDNQLDKLAGFFQTDYVSFLKNKPTLWISEMTENDFPRLPVIQDRNLLVAITTFKDGSDYQSQLNLSAELKNRMLGFLARKSSLIIYPTEKSLLGGYRLNRMHR
ncbi:MAG: hypothetical protein M3R14_13280 [Acidobacteriota bacterium]|nr:hypothetical protein [Acidobacteriota bacterium]